METLNLEAELQMLMCKACLTYLNAKKIDKWPNVQQVVDRINGYQTKVPKQEWMQTMLFWVHSKGSRTVKFSLNTLETAEGKSYSNRAVHYIWRSVLPCKLRCQLSLLLSNLLINTWSSPEQSRTTRKEIMEEHLASSHKVQKPCQTPFKDVSITDGHH